MHSHRLYSRLVFLALSCALLWAGCAQQDLYEPPGAPFTRVGSVSLPSQNEGVAVMGNYAFVAGGQAGLHSIDFTIPSQPRLVQTLNTLKYTESIEVVRTFVGHQLQDIALVVEGTEGITSYDITDPTAMTSFNSGTTAVFGNRVFVDQPEDPEEPYVCYLAESWKGRPYLRIDSRPAGHPGLQRCLCRHQWLRRRYRRSGRVRLRGRRRDGPGRAGRPDPGSGRGLAGQLGRQPR